MVAGVLLVPSGQDVQVANADHERDQNGLGRLAMGEPVFGIGQVDVVSLEPAVESFVLCPDGFVGALPGVGEVVEILAEFPQIFDTDGDGGLAADPRQLVRGGRTASRVCGQRSAVGRSARALSYS